VSVELGSIVTRSDLLCAPVDDEVVLFDAKRGNYLALDPTGRRIWELLAEPRRVETLITLLAREYDGAPDTIAGDVVAFLEELEQQGAVHVASP
jgi:coenzyme PQQ synthesis protein D (PqqD)